MAPGPPAVSAANGFGLPFEGLRLLRREPALWALTGLPAVLSLVALAVALGLIVQFAPELHHTMTDWLPDLAVSRWWEWLWVGPATVGLWLLGKLLFTAAVLVALVAAFLVANVAAAPFHDALSRRVEQLVAGRIDEAEASGFWEIVREGGRAVREELRRVLFFLVVWAGLAAVGLLLPGGALLAPPAMTLFTLYFLPLDYAGFALDRRRLSFAEKRAWLRGHTAPVLGFGAAAFAFTAIPFLNVLATPVLVVAGTLLTLRCPPLSRASAES